MVASIAIVTITCLDVIYAVIKGSVLPKCKFPLYPLITALGAIIVLLTGVLPLSEAKTLLLSQSAVNPLKILVLFFSMSALSVYLDEAGFFNYVAVKMLRYVKRKQIYLFLLLYALVSVLTVFTSNDIVILTFTPFLCYFCKSAKISPLPYLFAEFVAANTFSMLLIIGNPTNIYLSLASQIGFIEYFKVMWLPSLLGGVAALSVMLLIFRHQLKEEIKPEEKKATLDMPRAVIGGICLALATVALAVSDFLPFEMWQIAFFFALLLFSSAITYKIFTGKKSGALNTFLRIPWSLLPFMLSMFILVEALNYNGVCAAAAKLLSGFDPIVTYGVLSTLFANLVNNIPMSVLFGSVLNVGGVGMAGAYATVIGSNLGAYLTPIGALAGIMWGQILKEQNVKFTFLQFCKKGVLIVVPTLAAALIGLFLSLSL